MKVGKLQASGEPYLPGEAAIIVARDGCHYFLLTAVYCEE
jgi:hypothetical protein